MTPLKKLNWNIGIGIIFGVFILISWLTGYTPGTAIGQNFLNFLIQMLKILPCVFILIGLFDVWIKTETIERHLGQNSGPLSFLWAILLAGTIVGGFHVALPIAHALYCKRARLSVVLAFLFCAGICRVPMTLFEASFLGWRFTSIRFIISIPFIILASITLAYWFERKGYQLPNQEKS